MDLQHYLMCLYRDFADNRKPLNEKWRHNKMAYDGVIGNETVQRVGLGNKGPQSNEWRSKTVLNLTRTKVNAAEILVNDVICAGNELPFLLKDFNFVPDGRRKDDVQMPDKETIPPEYQGLDIQTIFELEKQKSIGIIQKAFQDGQIDEQTAQQAIEQTVNAQLPPRPLSSSERMSRLINEQLHRADALTVLKKAIKSAAIYGEGVGKMFATNYPHRAFKQNPETMLWDMSVVNDSGIGMKSVSVFNFFTDIEDRDIQKNAGLFERTYMSKDDVIALYREDDPSVLKSELQKFKDKYSQTRTMSKGSQFKDDDSPELRLINNRKHDIEVLEFWGKVPENLANDFEMRVATEGFTDNVFSDKYVGDTPDNGYTVECTAVIVDGCILKFKRTDGMSRPYFRVDWESSVDDISPKSIADIVDTMQQSLNSALRLYEDNKKLSANVIFGIQKRFYANKNEPLSIYPGKTIEVNDSCDDVRKALQPIQVPDVGESLLNVINLYRYNLNEQSMIPDIAHGTAADSKTTAYEISLQNEKAGKYISSIVKHIDTGAIEPIVRFFYEWNMYDENVTDECKGSYDVKALGFSSFQDKASKLNKIMQIYQMVGSNEMLMSMVDLKALLRDAIKANDADPELYLTDDPNLNNIQDIKFNQFAQQVGQQLEAFGQQLQSIINQLPQLSKVSNSQTDINIAKADKLRADAERTRQDIRVMQQKMLDNRAKTIAQVESKARQNRLDDIRYEQEMLKKGLSAMQSQYGNGVEDAEQTTEPLSPRQAIETETPDVIEEQNPQGQEPVAEQVGF